MTHSRRESFLEQGIAAFGREGIEEIISRLDDGLKLAARELDVLDSFGPVELKVVTDTALQAGSSVMWGTHNMGVISIGLNPAAAVERIVDVADRYGVHEVAHKAHFLQPAARAEWRTNSPFNAIIKEGVATHIEHSLTHEAYWPDYYLNATPAERRGYDDVLARALYQADPRDYENYTLDNKGGPDIFTVGTYVVGLMAALHDLTPREVVAVSFDAYRDFAQNEL